LRCVAFFAAGTVLLKKLAFMHNYALATGNPTIAMERTLHSPPALKNNNQSTMMTQEAVTVSIPITTVIAITVATMSCQLS
jgi:hypothetical protein